MPYRLFALSNLGSMLALLSYPPLIEPNMPTISSRKISLDEITISRAESAE